MGNRKRHDLAIERLGDLAKEQGLKSIGCFAVKAAMVAFLRFEMILFYPVTPLQLSPN